MPSRLTVKIALTLNRTDVTPNRWPFNVANNSPVLADHNVAVPCSLDVATRLPSGLNSPRVTTFRCQLSLARTAHSRRPVVVCRDHASAILTELRNGPKSCDHQASFEVGLSARTTPDAYLRRERMFSSSSGRTSAASGSAADIGNAPGVVRPSEYPSASARPRGNASFGSPSTSNAKICVPRPSSTHSDWGVVGEQRFSNNDQRSPLGLRIQSFRRHALIQQSKQRTEGLGLMRRALAMIPPWAAKLKVAEQSFKRHRMVSFQPLGFPQCGQARRVSRYSST